MSTYDFAAKLDGSKDYVRQLAAWFAAQYPEKMCHVEDMQSDPASYHKGDIRFFPPESAQFIEVKVEAGYTSKTTPNLAIERYSDVDRKIDGGAWQTTAQWYTHLYMDGLIVMMNRTLLVLWMDKYKSHCKPFRVSSTRDGRTWSTTGYLVNRAIAKAQIKGGYKELWMPMEQQQDKAA